MGCTFDEPNTASLADELVRAVLRAGGEVRRTPSARSIWPTCSEPSALNAIGLPTYAAVDCSPWAATTARQRRAVSAIASSHDTSRQVPSGERSCG